MIVNMEALFYIIYILDLLSSLIYGCCISTARIILIFIFFFLCVKAEDDDHKRS